MWGCFLMSGVKILHFLKDWWKSIPIHQNYTMALSILIQNGWKKHTVDPILGGCPAPPSKSATALSIFTWEPFVLAMMFVIRRDLHIHWYPSKLEKNVWFRPQNKVMFIHHTCTINGMLQSLPLHYSYSRSIMPIQWVSCTIMITLPNQSHTE